MFHKMEILRKGDHVDKMMDIGSSNSGSVGAKAVAATSINNGFLWLVALIPLVWVVQTWFFVAIPLECTLEDAFAISEYIRQHAFEDPLLEKIFVTSTLWAMVADTFFYIMDELEVNRRGFSLGSMLRRWTAYIIPPFYVWIRGAPELNNGKRNVLPYIAWWVGAAVICYFDGGCAYVAVALAIALTPWLVGAFGKMARPAQQKKATPTAAA